MITKLTVLILGAGASMPYNFPSGRELLENIYEGISSDNKYGWKYTPIDFGFEWSEVDRFREHLYNSEQPSVDAFLEHRPEFLGIGKISIALSLIQQYEMRSKICRRDNDPLCWYHYLYDKMKAPFRDFDKNKLSIITFNYDRSIEQYLFTSLRYTFDNSDKETAEKLSKIPIVHVYGQLGYLSWQKGGRSYFKKPTMEQIKTASEQIIIFSEGEHESKEFNKAYEIIKNAERIYFLGFGYHEVNVKRLRIGEFKSKKPIRGTGLGLGKAEKRFINNHWGINIPEEGKNDTILPFFKNFALLE